MSKRKPTSKVVKLEVHVRVPNGFPLSAVCRDVRSRITDEVGYYDMFPTKSGELIDMYKAVKAVRVRSFPKLNWGRS